MSSNTLQRNGETMKLDELLLQLEQNNRAIIDLQNDNADIIDELKKRREIGNAIRANNDNIDVKTNS